MGKECGAWSLGCFYEPHLKVIHITSMQLQCLKLNYIASQTAKQSEKNFPYMSPDGKGIGSVNTKQSLSPCLPHYSPLWRIYSSRSDQIPPLWKAFLNHSKWEWEFSFLKFYNAYYLHVFYTCHSNIIVFLFDYACLFFSNGILSSLKV